MEKLVESVREFYDNTTANVYGSLNGDYLLITVISMCKEQPYSKYLTDYILVDTTVFNLAFDAEKLYLWTFKRK